MPVRECLSQLKWFQHGARIEPLSTGVFAVPNLSIKNVPEDVVARLRARAHTNHRSLQGELLDLACRAAQASDPVPAPERHGRSESGGSKTIEQIVAEHRQRQPHPVSDAPSSAELIRRERDER
jgi:antitoxin FitA